MSPSPPGIIRTALPNMDRELQDQYVLVIQARDMEGQMGSLSGSTSVTVTLTDVNDNPPRFAHSKRMMFVMGFFPSSSSPWNELYLSSWMLNHICMSYFSSDCTCYSWRCFWLCCDWINWWVYSVLGLVSCLILVVILCCVLFLSPLIIVCVLLLFRDVHLLFLFLSVVIFWVRLSRYVLSFFCISSTSCVYRVLLNCWMSHS